MARNFSPKPHNPCSTTQYISIEVYLRVVSRGTSYCRSRLAFHPYAQIIQAICTSALVRSSTSLWGGFNLSRHRSTGFGYPTNDSKRAHSVPRNKTADNRFPYGFGDDPLNLAIDQNSLARYSKRTTRRRAFALSRLISLWLFGFRLFAPPVRGTFQLSLTLLVHYRSRVIFRIGCLWHPNSRAISDARYSSSLYVNLFIPTGLSPSMVRHSSQLRISR